MSIFSRIRKAKKAAADHKKETTQAEESKPPVVPYKHIPTHAAQDALAANPIRWTHEETKARIAEAKQRMSMRVPSTPPTVLHTRANSEHSFPTQPMVRPAHSDLSIVSVMQRPNSDSNSNSNPHFANTKPPVRKYEVPLRLNYNDHNYPAPPEFHAFSTPRDAPMPPLADTRGHLRHRSTASRSSTTRRTSPLSTVSMGQDPEPIPSSEQSRTSSAASTHSSFEQGSRRSSRSFGRTKLPSLPMPRFISHKQEPTLEISLPYGIQEDLSSPMSRIPTWRYEDFTADTEPPFIVEALSRTHSNSSSISKPMVLHKQRSVAVN